MKQKNDPRMAMGAEFPVHNPPARVLAPAPKKFLERISIVHSPVEVVGSQSRVLLPNLPRRPRPLPAPLVRALVAPHGFQLRDPVVLRAVDPSRPNFLAPSGSRGRAV